MLLANKVRAPAKAGALAPLDVVVPAQNTGMGPEKTSFFQALQIPTKITKGTIDITGDLNCTLGNLGWDLQSLEEGSLLWSHTSVLGWHHDIQRSEGSSLGRGSDLIGQQHVPDLDQI